MLKKWCEVTSCNGIIDLYESKENKYSFCFWTFILTCATLTTVWFVYRTVEGYITTPYVTNVGLMTSSHLDMPDVMACYMGGVNVSTLREEGFNDIFIRGFSIALSDSGLLVDDSVLDNLQVILDNYTNFKNITVMDFIELVSYKCEEIISFFRIASPAITPCEKSRRFIDGRSGQCFIYRNNTPQYYPEMRGGIMLGLQQPANSYYSVFNPTESYVGYMSDGFAITLEKSMALQRTGRSISIPMNVKADIALNTKHYIRIGNNRDCDRSPELYSSNTCFFNCFVDSVLEKCGCFLLNYMDQNRIADNRSICSPFKNVFVCNDNSHRECQQKCTPKCNEWIFEASMSYTTMARKDHEANRSLVSIAYQTMQYTQIVEVESFSIDMAVANVGGQFGLWLGASVVTIIQAGYYLCIGICNKRFVRKAEFSFVEKGTQKVHCTKR